MTQSESQAQAQAQAQAENAAPSLGSFRIFRALLRGLGAAGVIAAIRTAMDWLENPSGIFHCAQGPNWRVILETWFSWFWTGAVVPTPIFLGFALWRRRRQLP